MKQEIKLLDVVALLEDLPEIGLLRGQVGTGASHFCNKTVGAIAFGQ